MRRAAIPEDKSLEGLDAAVVGTGPAGLFAASALAARGAAVTVLEQGPPLEDRVSAVRNLWRAGALSGDANVQFGEGGAGTFSDGKLTTRIKDPLVAVVLSRFVGAGAPETILSEAHPHLGTDGVRRVVRAMREQLETCGTAFQFRRTVLSVRRSGAGYEVETGDGRARADAVFLAVGHSSRPLFRSLMAMGVPFRPKGMAVGVRVEHPQSWADACQYGRYAGHPDLPPSEYFLTFKDGPTGRGVYSFCMCPGGVVVNSASEPDGLVTNGMSMSHRASGRANAGIVVTVEPRDFGGDPLRGVAFQEDLERRAFLLGGGGYRAPAQRIRPFLDGRSDEAFAENHVQAWRQRRGPQGLFPSLDRGTACAGIRPLRPHNAGVYRERRHARSGNQDVQPPPGGKGRGRLRAGFSRTVPGRRGRGLVRRHRLVGRGRAPMRGGLCEGPQLIGSLAPDPTATPRLHSGYARRLGLNIEMVRGRVTRLEGKGQPLPSREKERGPPEEGGPIQGRGMEEEGE